MKSEQIIYYKLTMIKQKTTLNRHITSNFFYLYARTKLLPTISVLERIKELLFISVRKIYHDRFVISVIVVSIVYLPTLC